MKTTPSCLYYYYCFYFLEPSFLSLSLSLASTEHPGLAAGPSMPRGLQQPPCTLPLLSVAGFCPSSTPNSPCHRAPGTGRLQEMALSCQMPWQSETKKKKKKYLQSGCKKCRFVYHGEKLGHRPSVPSRCSFPRGLALPVCSGEATGQSSLLPTCRPFLPKSGARHLPRGCRGSVLGAGCRAPLAHPDCLRVLPTCCLAAAQGTAACTGSVRLCSEPPWG